MATSAEILALATQYHATGNIALAEQYASKVLSAEPNHAGALHLLGLITRDKGQPKEALVFLDRSLTANGSNALAWQHAGDLLLANGDLRGGISYYEQALRLRPDFADGFNTLGMTLQRVGQSARAAECFRQATRLAPGMASAHNNLGSALRSLGRLAEAVAAFEAALKLWPDSPDIAFNLGNSRYDQGDWQGAIDSFRRALSLKPAYAAEVCNSLATALRKLGLWEEAVAQYQEALRLHPGHGMALYNLSEMAVAGHHDYQPEELAQAKQVVAAEQGGEEEALCERSRCAFAVGNVLDQQGAFDEAFRYYHEANDLEMRLLQKRKTAFNASAFQEHVDKVIADHGRPYFETIKDWGTPTELPVFLVGMPCSGVRLLDETLGRHPRIRSTTGSLRRYLAQSAVGKDAAATTAQLLPTRSATRTAAASYLEHLSQLGQGAARVLVNSLDNVLNLGMIATLFPGARVIHCRREPVDLALACYFQNRRDLAFTLSLDDIGVYYLAHEKLMAHWAHVAPLKISEATYEGLVQDREKTVRALFAFCGLDWDDRCAAGSGQAGESATDQPAVASVGDRIGHSRHYRAHVGSLIKALEG